MLLLDLLRVRKRKRSEEEEEDVCASPAPPQSSSAPGATQTPEPLLAAARMFERGVRMADIAHILQVDERNIAMALVKRARKGRRLGEPANSQAPQAIGGPRHDEALQLAARLQHDPPELICPILHCLMEDPVVAEDGYSYERKGIEDALAIRSRSPMTNEPMGEVMLPNRALRSKIQEYKGVVVAEILSVTPCLLEDSPGDAAALLARAEELVTPKLPDRSARKRLVELVQLRSRLPQTHRASAAAELVSLLAQDDDSVRLGEVLDRFDALFDSVSLRSLEEEAALKLFEVATAQARPTGLCSCLGRELVRRAAERLEAAEGEEAISVLQKLWQLLVKLCSLDDEAWAHGTAAILASSTERLELELPALSTSILERASHLADDSEALDAAVSSVLGAALPESLTSRGSPALCAVLMELASRQEDEAAIQTLMQACRLDLQNGAIRRSLLALELRRFQAGHPVDVPSLLSLLHSEGALLPAELLKRLRLEPEEIREVPAPALLALVEQLAVTEGCGPAAARAAVAAAQQQAAEGELTSEETFRRAFALDRHNEAAAEGAVRAGAAASGRCARLEEQVMRLEREKAELEEQLHSRDEALQEALAQLAKTPTQARMLWNIWAFPALLRWVGPR